MNQLKKSIIATLSYSDIFNFPLTKNELYQNLITPVSVSRNAFDTALISLHENGNVCQTASYFHLPGRASIIKKRIQRRTSSQTKQLHAKKIAQKMIHLPYVEAVFLTGAVAVNNAPSNDDIDIMVVTTRRSLWTCRLLVNCWLDLHRLRRHPHSVDVKDKMCANLFLSRDNLKISRNRQNNYTAHEIVQSTPLADPYNLHDVFIMQNSWINQFLPHAEKPKSSSRIESKQCAPDWLEMIMRNVQMIYMKPKLTREIISHNAAFFHPRNTAVIVQAQFNKRLKEMKI